MWNLIPTGQDILPPYEGDATGKPPAEHTQHEIEYNDACTVVTEVTTVTTRKKYQVACDGFI